MIEKVTTPEIQDAVNYAFSLNEFERKGLDHLDTAINLLSEVGVLEPISFPGYSDKFPWYRYGIEGLNFSGKTSLMKFIEEQNFHISRLFGNDRENNSFGTFLIEPASFPVEEMVRHAISINDPNLDYRDACKNKIKNPFHQTLAFIIARNRSHICSSFIRDMYYKFDFDSLDSSSSDNLRFLSRFYELRGNNSFYSKNNFQFLKDHYNPRFPLEFFHDRNQISTFVFQSLLYLRDYEIPYNLSIEKLLSVHNRLEEMNIIDKFSAQFVLIPKKLKFTIKRRKTISNRRSSTRGDRRESDQYEDVISQRDAMIMYLRVSRIIKENSDVPLILLENDVSGKKNSIEELGLCVCNLLGNIRKYEKYLYSYLYEGIDLKIPDKNGERCDIRDVDLGELCIRDGKLFSKEYEYLDFGEQKLKWEE